MAYISFQPSDYFNTKLYTGNGGSLAVTGVGFQPDWLWIKQRNTTRSHQLMDALRGASKRVFSDQDAIESSSALTSFDSDGFTVDGTTLNGTNVSSGTYASWNWKANGSGSANTDGSISSTVSANTTAGFSIVTFTGTDANGTVGHGLSTAPRVIYCKKLTGTVQNWFVFNKGLYDTDSTAYINLNTTDGKSQSSTVWQSTAPTSSVFSIGAAFTDKNYVAYCFSDVKGFSKSGVYSGNNSSDGTFVYTGFRPAWVMVKRYGANGFGWAMYDNKRDPGNVVKGVFNADTNAAENTATDWLDLTSNGFKFKTTGGDVNASSDYIYHAFAEHPLVSSNDIPAVAR